MAMIHHCGRSSSICVSWPTSVCVLDVLQDQLDVEKTFTIIAFTILDFLLGDARTCVLCQQNHPLDATTEQAFDALHQLGTVVRIVSVSKERQLRDEPESLWHACCKRSNHTVEPSKIEGNVLAVATAHLACSTFQGRPVHESTGWRYIFGDEGQVLATREAGLVG